ncbi:unnamed protein product [Miscanthus lutarioriparius]|uniref:Uncharacterized protein n=1 Tax=Miscanthus lutarioriparius TaxID=422564 RepID=A0A811SDZ5_9POAL|nr:unnamed protein product [Miscanthus lutarioriparius]
MELLAQAPVLGLTGDAHAWATACHRACPHQGGDGLRLPGAYVVHGSPPGWLHHSADQERLLVHHRNQLDAGNQSVLGAGVLMMVDNGSLNRAHPTSPYMDFSRLADQLLPNFFKLVTHIIRHNRVVLRHRMLHVTESFRDKDPLATVAARVASVAFVGLAVLPFLVMCYVPAFLYVYGGPVACIALAIWRTVQRDYGGGGDDKANLAPALDMFYSLVLLQGGLLLVWLYHESWWVDHLITLRQHCKLPNTAWCRLALVEFLCDTRARCWRNLSSIRGRKLVDYAVSLLDSGSWDDNLSGARLLDEFIRQGCDMRSLLLPSRPKIQKLIDSLGWREGRRPEDAEMRKLAARIVAHLAGGLHLAQFPGAIQCISYLLQDEATLAYSDQQGLTHHPQRRLASEKQAMILRLERREREREARHQKKLPKRLQRDGVRLQQQQQEQQLQQQQQQRGGGSGACNELILQGLAILERLASDHHNRGEISGSSGLLAKITAPLYSGRFVQGIGIADWVHVANATFKVVYQLIHAPGETSARLRTEISSNKQAMSNLDTIIVRQEAQQELKMRAMEILTELALDLSIDLPRETKRALMKKQMHIFLTGEGDLRATAGRTRTSVNQMMIAAEILENMCAHCGKQRVKDILLPKGQDEENQNIPTQGETPSSRDQNKSSDQGNEGQTATKALQEKLLSLTLVMYAKLENADFSIALQNNGSAFVAKLKSMVEENCQATVCSLNIVKLCGQIALSMMQRNQYTEHFKHQEFVKSLCKARKIMSNLESCVLFAGTGRDHGLRKMAWPLLFDLEKEAERVVG